MKSAFAKYYHTMKKSRRPRRLEKANCKMTAARWPDDMQERADPENDEQIRDRLEQCLQILVDRERFGYLGSFVRGFIHNINGPLHNISMLTEMLLKGLNVQEQKTRTQCAERSEDWEEFFRNQRVRFKMVNQQISNLVDLLRDFMVLNEMDRCSETMDVNLVIMRLLNVFKCDLFFKHEVTLNVQLTKNLPMIPIPGHDLIPALVHVIRNALTAMKGSEQKSLLVESYLEGDRVCIVVTDSGCGIDGEDDVEGVPCPFRSRWRSREDAGMEGSERHLGIGLFAARRLLGLHRASLRLERLPHGTRARVEIPLSAKR
ncbi:MAG: sensor histidine kinase [Syntrophobacteraceae bacterium]|nr:sensor histidine kinase [Syntrophobacteraceae bacterium]